MTTTNDFRTGRKRKELAGVQKRQPFTRTQRTLLIVGTIVGVLSILAIIGSVLPTQSMKESEFADSCRSSIERQLKDPESAQIEDPIFGVQVVDADEGNFEMLGTGRAKNGFGGMASFAYKCTGGYSDDLGRAHARAKLEN